MIRYFVCASISIAVILLSAGCDQLTGKDTKQTIQMAEKKAAEGEFKEAIRLYESALDGSTKTADVHYKLAVLYDEKLKSPGDALHHFRRYLELAPKGNYAKEAKAYQREGELKLAAQLSKGSTVTQEEAVRLKNENLSLRKQIVDLRMQKTPAVAAAAKTGGNDAQKPIPPGARTHVVQAGDTLASIALKYYKNKARWKDIQDANFYSLDGTAKIKPGQTLIIP